jgi:hypothetical protein
MASREPAIWIGALASIAVAILVQIAGSGLVDGKGLVIVNDLVVLIPIVAGIIIRSFVTPTAAPVLSIGTPVTTPGSAGMPGLAAVVSGASPNQP